MIAARYAVYLAPPSESELWRFGSRVLGRDAATGEAIHGYAPAGDDPEAWRQNTAEPRRYGFHATLKAPFRLRPGMSLAELEGRIAEFAASVEPFDLGELAVSTIAFDGGRGFVALRPTGDSDELRVLERRAVQDLNPLRAPMSEDERKRRAPDRLTPRQRRYLDAWGYPYVLDEFRLHFTLSAAVENAAELAERIARDFRQLAGSPRFAVDALALFAQDSPADDFRIIGRFPFRQP
jgi:2'-5' RNA ligase